MEREKNYRKDKKRLGGREGEEKCRKFLERYKKMKNRGRENKEYILQVRPTDEDEERTWDKI